MATRHRLDHDLDPNQHRYLGGRGADVTITSGGDLTLGACNYANVTTAGGILRRVQTANWTQGSVILLRAVSAFAIQPGYGADSGFVGISTPDGQPFDVDAGALVILALDGAVWCLPKAGSMADDHLVKARSADATTVGGVLEKTANSANITREVTVIGGVERVRHSVIPTTRTPLPGVAGGRVGTGPLLAFDDHRHPLESPAVVSSYLFPVQLVTRAPSTSEQLPAVGAVVDQVVTVTHTDLSTHGYANSAVVAVLPDDPDVYLRSVTCELSEQFAGSDLESLKFYLVAQRNYYDPSGTISTDYSQDLIPEPSARSTFPDGFEAVGREEGTEWPTNPMLELQCLKNNSGDQTVSIFVTSNLILDAVTAGAFTITLHFERRTHSNSHCVEVDHILEADGENTGASKTLALWCPIAPNSGLRLNGLRIGVQSPLNTYPEGLSGDIKIGLRTADGTVVVSPFDIRQQTYDTYWEFLGIDIPFTSQLLLTVSRSSGTIADLGTGLLQFDYTCTQTTGGEVTPVGYQALTAAQEAERDTEPFAFDRQINASSGEVLMGQVFATLAGTPGVSAIPAEEHLFQVRGKIDYLGNINFATVNKWRATVSILRFGQSTPDAPYLTVDGKAMFNTDYSVYEFAGTPESPPTITSLDTLVIAFYAVTDSTDMVGFYLSQDEQLSTRVRFPFSLGGAFGTLSHKELDKPSKGWTAGQEKYSALFEHPNSTMCPRFPAECSATIDADGILTIPDTYSDSVLVSGSALRAIVIKDASGNLEFGPQAPLKLRFAESCTVYHLDALSGVAGDMVARVAKLDLLPPEDASEQDKSLNAKVNRTLRLWLSPLGDDLLWTVEVGQ